MNLNLHILWDELQPSGGELVCTNDIHSLLHGVRTVDSGSTAFSEQFLYLVDVRAAGSIPAEAGHLNFVCIGASDRSFFEKQGWSAILLPTGADPDQVFRQIQEVFEKYAQWEQEMLLAIANHEPLQSIFDLGARFLCNPIALFDISLVYIMKAGTLPADIGNTIWEQVLTKGYSLLEDLPLEEQRNMARALAARNEPFFYQNPSKYSQHQQMIASLKHDGTPFATFGMIDILQPFTLGQLSIVSRLKDLMELALRNDSHFASISEGSSYFVERLLQGLSVERNAVQYHLTRKSWRIEDDFCLVYFVRTDSSQIDSSMNDMYSFRIRSLLQDVMVFPYENGILAITHKENRIRDDRHFADELSLLLKNTGLCCGVSLVFQDFMNLKYAYIQCKTALTTLPDPDELGQRVFLFETKYTEYVIRALDASTSLKSLCHPRILALYQAEGGKGQEYVHSLQFYLVNGRNTTATASRLFIHRNTLLYRLHRIEEILGMDLAIADEQTLFMLYLSCLITNYVT